MADLIKTKATFPKSGGLSVADGAVSVNAGNGLHVNPSTGMVEVPVDTTAGLGYGSNGLEVEVDGSTIDFNASGQLTALGGGEVTQKVVSLVAGQQLTLNNLTMDVQRSGIYFVTVSQQQTYDALLINAVFATTTELAGPRFNFTCPNSNKATKWVVNSIEAPDLIRTQFKVPVLGGYVQRDAESYTNTYAVCTASETSLSISSFSSSRKSFYMYPLTVVRYH